MAAIGGVSCLFVRGHVPRWRSRLTLWQVPGLNGYGAKRTGKGDAEFRLVAEQKGTLAAVNTWIAALEDLVGTIVTVVNDFGDSFAYCLITRVGIPAKRGELGYGGVGARLEIEGVRKWQ